jgi:hypothetical protein
VIEVSYPPDLTLRDQDARLFYFEVCGEADLVLDITVAGGSRKLSYHGSNGLPPCPHRACPASARDTMAAPSSHRGDHALAWTRAQLKTQDVDAVGSRGLAPPTRDVRGVFVSSSPPSPHRGPPT